MEKKLRLIKAALPKLRSLSNPCQLCLHKCSVERDKGQKGICSSGTKALLYSYSPHMGEEPPLSGTSGSGTMFFAHCNMKCVYCQNYAFSQKSAGCNENELETRKLAGKMLELQKLGCHNINLVSPTHYACRIVEALEIAIEKSLNIPIVYNTGGYDTIELVKLLDGIMDIYLPDMRYSRNNMAAAFSSAPGYAENNRMLIKEMFRQVGVLKLNKDGVAQKGVIVRLLILPNNISGTACSLRFLKENVSEDIFLSVMSQYHPTYKAENYPELARRITKKEYQETVEEVEKLGFKNGWIQALDTDPARYLGTNIKPTQ